jgi:hypothetical protein
MKKILITLMMMLGVVWQADAQIMFGNTGLMNIPTADMAKEGTFVGGATLVPSRYMRSYFNYNTGIYYFRITPLPWAEVTLRETLLKTRQKSRDISKITGDDNVVYGKLGFYQQDRSYTVRLRPIRESEGKWWPSIVLGANDPWSDNGGSYYSSAYGVATKHFNVGHVGNFSLSAGYYEPLNDRFDGAKVYDGFFGGVGYVPQFCDKLLFSADYDTQGINIGFDVLLFNHWNIYLYERDFKKFGFGMNYQYTFDW